MSIHAFTKSFFPFPLLLFAAVPLAAQSPIDEEIAFVRGVVSELRFVELAQFEVDQLKARYREREHEKQIAQLAVEVSIQGAKLHPDRKKRRELFKDAIDQSQQLIDSYDGEPVAHDARRTLVEACIEFGQFLNEDLQLARDDDADSAAIEKLEAVAATVFRTGEQAARRVREHFESRDGEEIQAFVAWMQRGILLREHARAVPKDRGYLAEQAVTTLEDLIFEVGEETALGQRALFEAAKVAEVTGDYDLAIQSYTDTIDAIWIALTGEFPGDLPEEVQRMMFQMMQEVYASLAAVCLEEGSLARIDAAVAQLRERETEFRTEPHPVYGDSLQLTQARARANSRRQSEVSAALRAAREINERHPHDFVGLRAKNLIRDILRASSELVTGDLLFEVAKGNYQAKDYEAAVAGFKRALVRMDAESKQLLGFESWNLIGRSNEKMRRYLEAAMAYARALEEHGTDTQVADEALVERIAARASYCFKRASDLAGKPAVFGALEGRIDSLLRRFSPGFATANDYDRGLRAKSDREYAEAAKHFFRVRPDYEKYELALAHGILCLYYQDEYDDALEKIAELREHTAEQEIAEDERAARVYRAQSLAWAHYAEGRIRYARAVDAEGRTDREQLANIVKHFREFESDHAEHASNLMQVVHEILGRLYIEMHDDAKAIARYRELKKLAETVPNAHRTLGLALFADYDGRIQKLEAQLDALDNAGKPADELEDRLEATRKRVLDLGLDFAKSVQPPTYPVLYNLMRVAEDLEDWKSCEWAAEKILALYGETDRSSLDQVRPVLGEALLRQSGRLREALDVLEEAEKQWTEDESKPRTSAYYEVLRFKALALGGWPAFDADGINYAPNPGLSRPDDAYEILWGDEYRKFALNSKRTPRFSLEWYRYYLELYYVCREAQRIDSKFKQRATTIYNIARSTDNFATLRRLGRRGRNLATLFNMIGF